MLLWWNVMYSRFLFILKMLLQVPPRSVFIFIVNFYYLVIFRFLYHFGHILYDSVRVSLTILDLAEFSFDGTINNAIVFVSGSSMFKWQGQENKMRINECIFSLCPNAIFIWLVKPTGDWNNHMPKWEKKIKWKLNFYFCSQSIIAFAIINVSGTYTQIV